MLNLAQSMSGKKEQCGEIAQVISFPKPSLLKGAIVSTQKNEDGFTPLPNFICDEGYLAVLSGEAIKCLVFLNRHINGFHIGQRAMGESLVMKITGIKDKRTVRKYMTELAHYQLVEIHKENGKSNIYSITYSERLPAKPVASHVTGYNDSANQKPVASHVPSTSNAGTSHVTTPVASHVPTTSDMACHSVKEIDLKENIKEKKEEDSSEKSRSEDFLNSFEYHQDNRNLYSLRELAGVYSIQSDLHTQAKNLNSELADDFIFAELKGFAQWATNQSKNTAQGWMNFWIYRIQNLKSSKPKSQVQKSKAKKLSDSQINYFVSELCNYEPFTGKFSNPGEPQKSFEARIKANLRNPEHIKKYGRYLHELGFVVAMEDFA
ncbi:hypothetical protein ACVBEE_00495 [Acinetobacter sp. ANC 3781]